MALVCSKCSAENADGALVCRQCGAALPPPAASWSRSLLPDDDHFDPLSAPTLVMQHTAPAALPPVEETAAPLPARRSGRTLLLGLATGVLIVAAGAWLLRPGVPVAPPAAQPALASAPASAPGTVSAAPPAPAASGTSAASPALTAASAAPPPPAAPAAASTPIAVTAAAPVPAAASTAAAAASAAAAGTRKRIPEPVARKRALSAAPAATPAASAAPAPAPVEPVAAPLAAPAAPARPKTVAELCAAGNLITRGFCEQRECRRAELAADPVCVKLKDAEQRRLFQQ